MHPTILLTPLRPAISSTGAPLEVLIRIQAPPPPADATASRPQLRLALVVDRSGSMGGQPLDEALRCVHYIVDHLQPADEVAVVVYDNEVDIPVPLQPAAHKHSIHAALAGIAPGGNTALFDGWGAGVAQLGKGRAGAVSRVLLLSDGQANNGPATADEVAPHCARALADGVSTTTVGLGAHFNEDLMTAMARAGGGQAYYGQRAEDLHDNFTEELSLLESLFLRLLRLKLAPAEGVIVEPLGAFDVPAVGDGTHSLSDLPWAAESWMLVRLHVAAQPASAGVPRALLAGTLEAVRKDGTTLQAALPMLQLPVVSGEAFVALPEDELVARRLKEVEFARMSRRARQYILDGDSHSAREVLRVTEAQVADQPWLRDKLARLKALAERDEAMAVKEMRYSASRLVSRVAAVSEDVYLGDETNSKDSWIYLRRKRSEGEGRKD